MREQHGSSALSAITQSVVPGQSSTHVGGGGGTVVQQSAILHGSSGSSPVQGLLGVFWLKTELQSNGSQLPGRLSKPRSPVVSAQVGAVVQQSVATHGSSMHCLPAVVPLMWPVQSNAITGLPGPGSMLLHVWGGARVQHKSAVHFGSPSSSRVSQVMLRCSAFVAGGSSHGSRPLVGYASVSARSVVGSNSSRHL